MIAQSKKALFILLANLLTTPINTYCSDNDTNVAYLSSEYSDTDSDSETDNSMIGMYKYEDPQILVPFPTPVYAQQDPIHVLEGAGIKFPETTVAPATAAALMNQNQKNKKIKTVTGTQTDLEKKQKIARIICRPQEKSKDKQQCSTCNNYYSNLSMHMLIHEEKNPNLACNTCAYIAVDASRLRIHEKIHTGHTFPCPQCPGKTFSTLTNLNRHNKDIHQKQKLIPCSRCGHGFKRLSDKNRHEQRVHKLQLQ